MTDPALIDLRRSPRLEQIMADISAESGFTILELLSPRRLKPLAAARHKAFYRACTETALSLPQIGRAYNRDHTTIIYGRDKHARKAIELRRDIENVLLANQEHT